MLELDLKPSDSKLRWFAGLWFPLFGAVLGAMLFRKFHAPVAAFSVWSAVGLLAVFGVFSPSVIHPVYVLIMRLTFPVGWAVSHVMMAVIYFLVISPIGFLVRLTQHIPKGTERIDGRGKFLMPGLADMHVHLNVRGSAGLLKNEDYAVLFLANGSTHWSCRKMAAAARSR